MRADGQLVRAPAAQVLAWSGQVLTADALPPLLGGQRELLVPEKAIVTPLAADELRRRGIRLVRQKTQETANASAAWGIAQEQKDPGLSNMIQALRRDGSALRELELPPVTTAGPWAKLVAEHVASGACPGAIAICLNAGLCCCLANKIAGIRAVAVASALHAVRATSVLGANLLAIERALGTFNEIRQIFRKAGLCPPVKCPPELALMLRELDGHAHR
jgi:hypothetical protein